MDRGVAKARQLTQPVGSRAQGAPPVLWWNGGSELVKLNKRLALSQRHGTEPSYNPLVAFRLTHGSADISYLSSVGDSNGL